MATLNTGAFYPVNSYTPVYGQLVYSTSTTATSVTISWTLNVVASKCAGYTFYASCGRNSSTSTSEAAYTNMKSNTAVSVNTASGTTTYKVGSGSVTLNRSTSAYNQYLFVRLTYGSSNKAATSAAIPIAALAKYTVSYDVNSGSSTKTSETVYYGKTGTFPTATQCTRESYELLGWSTSSSATSASYTSGTTTPTITANTTYYAVWKQLDYTLTLVPNNGSANITVPVTYGKTIASTEDGNWPDSISRYGYDFVGWLYNGTQITLSTTYNYNSSITAVGYWKAKTFTENVEDNIGQLYSNSYTLTYDTAWDIKTILNNFTTNYSEYSIQGLSVDGNTYTSTIPVDTVNVWFSESTKTLTVAYDDIWKNPTVVKALDVMRCNQAGDEDDEGDYVSISTSVKLNRGNAITAKAYIVNSSGSSSQTVDLKTTVDSDVYIIQSASPIALSNTDTWYVTVTLTQKETSTGKSKNYVFDTITVAPLIRLVDVYYDGTNFVVATDMSKATNTKLSYSAGVEYEYENHLRTLPEYVNIGNGYYRKSPVGTALYEDKSSNIQVANKIYMNNDVYVDNNKVSDVVIEVGTDNTWEYKKYSDGTYDAYRTWRGTSVFTSSYSGWYTAASMFTATVPSFSTSLTWVEGSAVTYTGTTRSTNTLYSAACLNRSYIDDNYIRLQPVIAASRSTAVAVDVFAHIRGTWK